MRELQRLRFTSTNVGRILGQEDRTGAVLSVIALIELVAGSAGAI